MALPDFTNQDNTTYKTNIDATAADHETRIDTAETALGDLKTKVIEIGDWNMDTTYERSLSMADNGLTLASVRGVASVLIRPDLDLSRVDGNYNSGLSVLFTSASVVLRRVAAGEFDNPSYTSTGFNRGWVTVYYV